MSQFGLPDPNDNLMEDDSSERFYKQHSVDVIVAPSTVTLLHAYAVIRLTPPVLDVYAVIRSTPQVYFHMKVGKIPVIKGMGEDCISHVHRWLASSRLRFNLDKTEVIWCSSATRAGTFDQPSLTIGHSTISPSNVVRDLGVLLRDDLSVTYQVSKIVRSCNQNIQQLRTIRSSFSPDALRDAAYALILSRLDYCNAFYMNAPMCEFHRLQMLYTDSKC